jgi:ribose transport system ATP-binding protein
MSTLQMKDIVKTYSGVRALRGVDLTLEAGSVHALVGENGAGKSTLIKVMTGVTAPTSGSIAVRGTPVSFRSPREAQAHGVVAVYQEVSVLDHLSVAENLFLGREPRRFGLVHWSRMNADARELLTGLGLDLDPRATLGELPIAVRQMVAIARGVSLSKTVLVLDEPTSSLTQTEVALLYELIHRVKQWGTAIVYISHRLDEIYAACDTVTVLRDGERVATTKLAEIDREQLIHQMLGEVWKTRAAGERRSAVASEPREPLLRATDLRHAPALKGVSFAVQAGEVVGLAGLLGSGRTETVRAVFGADRIDSGSVELGGQRLTHHSPREAIAAGAAFLAEDRGADGIIPELSVRENLTLAVLRSLARFGILSPGRERPIVDDLVRRLRIKVSSPNQKIRELSGGNQQKVLLARWICNSPRLLLADEPTRGIDIGAKVEVFSVLREMSEAGVAIVMISSELEEIASECSRVVVLRDGRSVAELSADAAPIEPDVIIRAIAGSAP